MNIARARWSPGARARPTLSLVAERQVQGDVDGVLRDPCTTDANGHDGGEPAVPLDRSVLEIAMAARVSAVAVGVPDPTIRPMDHDLDASAFGGAHGDGYRLSLGARALDEAASLRGGRDKGGAPARGDDMDVALAAFGGHWSEVE